MTTPVWSIDRASASITNNADGGFDVDFPLTLNGTKVCDIKGHMSGAGFLTITVVNLPGSVALTGFQAWSTTP
jgi:hypothetical protein